MPVPQPPRVVGGLANQPGANSGSGGNNRGQGNPSNPAPNIQGTPGSPCLISWPNASLPIVGSVGGGCVLSKTNVRAWVGGGLILISAFGGVLALGALLFVGFKKTGVLDKASAVAGFVPGGKAVGVGIKAAGRVAG